MSVMWIHRNAQTLELIGIYYEHTVDHPDSKVHEAYVGPIWGRQDPGGLHVDPMNFAIRSD